MCVASALSQVRSADPASGVCHIASCVLLCLNESEVRARKTHARKTRWLGTCVNPRVEYCTVVYASVTKTEQITDDNKCSLLLLFMSKLFICFGDAGPGRWGQRVKGEDKIIIATHSFHSNTFHYHPECVTNSTTPLITKLNLCPSPLRSTDCSVINMWVSGGGYWGGLADAATAFLHLILCLEQSRRKWTIQTDKCVPFRVKAKHIVAVHLCWGSWGLHLEATCAIVPESIFWHGTAEQGPVSNSAIKCSIWCKCHGAKVESSWRFESKPLLQREGESLNSACWEFSQVTDTTSTHPTPPRRPPCAPRLCPFPNMWKVQHCFTFRRKLKPAVMQEAVNRRLNTFSPLNNYVGLLHWRPARKVKEKCENRDLMSPLSVIW